MHQLRVCQLMPDTYKDRMGKFIGSVSMLADVMVKYGNKLGDHVEVKYFSDGLNFCHKSYDVVHIHTTFEPCDNVIKHFLKIGLPFITFCHQGQPWLTNCVMATPYMEEQMRRRNKRPFTCKTAAFGIDLERYEVCEDKEDYCVYINAISPKKAPLEIAQWCIMNDVRCKFAGMVDAWDGGARKNLINLIKRSAGLLEWLEVIDHDKKVELLGEAQCLLQGHIESRGEEGFCLTQLEAMACGTPVVAFGKIFEEVQQHTQTGYVFPNMDQWKNCFKGGRFNGVDWTPRQIREYVEKEYSGTAMYERYKKIYYEVIYDGELWNN